jgi:predicted nucleic acid-binding protein
MRRTFLVDTNHLSAAVNPVSRVRERLYQQHRQGARFRTCIPVVCEIEVGIQDSPHVDAYRRQLRHLLRKVKLVPLELDMTQAYGEVYRELRRLGRALSQVDMLLAAMVRHMKWTLLTSDRDFEALPDIRTENWHVL